MYNRRIPRLKKSSNAFKPLRSHLCSTLGRILRLDKPDPRTSAEKFMGLVHCHIMRPDLPDVTDFLSWQCHQILSYAQKHLSLYLPPVLPEQPEIREQSSGYGILNSHDSRISPAGFHGKEQVRESLTFHYLQAPTP